MGLLILGLGIIFMLDRLDVLYAGEILRLWPALLIMFGLFKILQSYSGTGKFIGLIFVISGSLLLIGKLTSLSFGFSDFLIILLIGLGTTLIWSSLARRSSPGILSTDESEDPNSYVNVFAFMGGIKRQCTSKDFKGGEATAIMGGCEIDLRNAEIKQDEVYLDIFALWGGIELRVPDSWTVILDGTPLLGGFEDTTTPSGSEQAKRLIIKGYAIMGGMEIKN